MPLDLSLVPVCCLGIALSFNPIKMSTSKNKLLNMFRLGDSLNHRVEDSKIRYTKDLLERIIYHWMVAHRHKMPEGKDQAYTLSEYKDEAKRIVSDNRYIIMVDAITGAAGVMSDVLLFVNDQWAPHPFNLDGYEVNLLNIEYSLVFDKIQDIIVGGFWPFETDEGFHINNGREVIPADLSIPEEPYDSI